MGFSKKVVEERGAFPLIVAEPVHKIGWRRSLQVVNPRDPLVRLPFRLRCRTPDRIVIDLRATSEGIEEIDLSGEVCPLHQPTAAVRLNLGREAAAVDPDLRRSVAIKIGRLHLECLAATEAGLSARQMSPNLMSQMRQVQATKYPMPVAVVTLSREELKPGLLGPASYREQPAKRQTLLVGTVGLRIPDQEMLPMASAQMGHKPIGIGAETALQLFKSPPPVRPERPLLHLDIGTGREVTESGGANTVQSLAHRLRHEPILCAFKQVQEPLQPSVPVDPLRGSRPAAELFAVVGSDGQPPAHPRDPAQVRLDLGRWAKRSEERRVGKECRSRWSP